MDINSVIGHTISISKYNPIAGSINCKYIKFPIKIRDIHKIERKSSISINVFGYENKEKQIIYVSKQCFDEKYVDFLLIGEGEKTLCSCQRFNIMEENILSLLFTLFHYRRNFKASY